MKENIIEYGNGIYAIDQGMVRIFLILGEKRGLVLDAGVEETDLRADIESITKLPVELCLTHSDRDHIANISAFESLYVHEDEAERLKATAKAQGMELKTVREGHCFDLGGRKLRVIDAPGHTPGSLCLIDEERGILFSGDTVSHASVYMFSDGRDMELYIGSLRKLDKLFREGAFSEIYPCHGECPIGGEAIAELIECAELIKAGDIKGTDSGMKDGGRPVLEYRHKGCGIYHV